ncbi:hypothetical protein KSP35_16200 [Aquihabitans sp. G128]|uniref:hypothetical protein n=1 Tax=Aquihabitans sp. G128 TaxID=2849779 RepID=UPI001C2398B5|nr:hypothetical protein [Aquihabitans sp. G128]QXC59907.1 hypothetical protein KSP35_16200 [Aquihabitans sp. G128]
MSIEVILIPIGIAAYSAYKERHRTDLCEGCRQTRITDPALLERTLVSLGATGVVVDFEGLVVTGQLGQDVVRFQLIGGAYLGRIDDSTDEATEAFVSAVDAEVGRLVQADKVDEMRTRAAQLGLVLVGEEVAEDGTVQLVFEEVEA